MVPFSYRIHLSPGSRRSSTRSAIARAMNSSAPGKRGAAVSALDTSSAPPLSAPPALEPARVYNHHSTPPDSPPPLAHATLPASHLAESASARSSTSPQSSYSSLNHHLVPTGSQGFGQPYSYRSGTTTYQEQSQGAGFTYVHTTPISHSSNASNGNTFSSYSSSHDSFSGHPVPHLNASSSTSLSQDNSNSQSSLSMSSRHSISHISHPQSNYSQNHSAGGGPPSPASSQSVSSHTSGPPTPTYAVFNDDAQAYHHGNNIMSQSTGHLTSHGQLVHNYPSGMTVQHSSRFDSPPPVLAPIQSDRVVRRSDDAHSQSPSHSGSPYIHHPQPLPEYQYPSMGMGSTNWKSENSMRKGVDSIVQ